MLSDAPVSAASPSSSRRQFDGCSPDCASARAAAAPAVKSSNSTPAEARKRGLSCTLTHASVITPSTPSEPIISRSGLGPAPEPGSRRLSHSPLGVIARTDSTRSSMWVHSVAKCPPARVATHPPSVEYSNDCG